MQDFQTVWLFGSNSCCSGIYIREPYLQPPYPKIAKKQHPDMETGSRLFGCFAAATFKCSNQVMVVALFFSLAASLHVCRMLDKISLLCILIYVFLIYLSLFIIVYFLCWATYQNLVLSCIWTRCFTLSNSFFWVVNQTVYPEIILPVPPFLKRCFFLNACSFILTRCDLPCCA